MKTTIIAQLIGILMITKSLFIIFRPKETFAVMDSYRKDQTLIIMMGFLAFFIGLAVTMFHPFWRTDKEILVGIIGVLIMGKGLVAIFYPKALSALAGKCATREMLIGSGITGLIIGALLAFNCF